MGASTHRGEKKNVASETETDPYSLFIGAIPEDTESQTFEHPIAENEIDKMSDSQYANYKKSLRAKTNIPETPFIASAASMKAREITNAKVDIAFATNSETRKKLEQFNALFNETWKKEPNVTPRMQQRAKQKNKMAQIDKENKFWRKWEEKKKACHRKIKRKNLSNIA